MFKQIFVRIKNKNQNQNVEIFNSFQFLKYKNFVVLRWRVLYRFQLISLINITQDFYSLLCCLFNKIVATYNGFEFDWNGTRYFMTSLATIKRVRVKWMLLFLFWNALTYTETLFFILLLIGSLKIKHNKNLLLNKIN